MRIESWRLFGVLAFAITVAICLGLPFTDFPAKHGTELIVRYSVLCALPCLLVAFTASSIAVLWPSRATRRLLANRRYIGLSFAYGMGLHFSLVAYFIFTFGNPLGFSDLALDLIGLLFLLAMSLTSFDRFSRRLTRRNWCRLHKTGIYVLWSLPTYFYLDDFRRDRDLFDLMMFSILLVGLLLRLAAWMRQSTPVKQAV